MQAPRPGKHTAKHLGDRFRGVLCVALSFILTVPFFFHFLCLDDLFTPVIVDLPIPSAGRTVFCCVTALHSVELPVTVDVYVAANVEPTRGSAGPAPSPCQVLAWGWQAD